MCTAGSVTPTYATVGIKRVGLNRKLVEPCQHLRLRTPDYHLHKFTNEFGFYAVSPVRRKSPRGPVGVIVQRGKDSVSDPIQDERHLVIKNIVHATT
jgi:hypothetical protein